MTFKSAAARALWSQTYLYHLVNRVRSRVDPLEGDFDLVFDGFPRSGNTFGSEMLRASQRPGLKVITHQHKPSLFFRAAQMGKPVCLTLRHPPDAICSWVIYTGFTVEKVIDYYIFFYETLLTKRSRFLVVPFPVVTHDFGLVLRLINARFHLGLETAFNLEACRQKAFARIDQTWSDPQGVVDKSKVARPDETRVDRKREVHAELSSGRHAVGLARCALLHQIYDAEYRRALATLPPETCRDGGDRPRSLAVAEERPRPGALKISVITPSYRQLPWLKLCIASVADQKGVRVEHIIQDAQSGPELEEWVRDHSRARLYVESDSGMYDAINRGFARATGDIVCWLNSDEQYLEGALAQVAHYFETHPETDVLFGDALLIGNTGRLLSYRRVVLPNRYHVQLSHLNVLSCATFVRRTVVERVGHLDSRWKAIADAVWIVEFLKAGVRMAVLPEPLAVFTITDKNLGQTSLAFTESARWQEQTLPGRTWLRPFFVLWHRLKKMIHGAYWPRSFNAHLYVLTDAEKRHVQNASYLGFKWPGKQ